jgi:hypothetical protein
MYIGNGYYHLENIENIENIKNIENIINKKNIYFSRKIKLEDMEIVENTNMMIYSSKGIKDDYNNIYRGVRVMITDNYTIEDDRYREIGDNVDVIIIDGIRYERREEEFEKIMFMSGERLEDYYRNNKDKIGEINSRGYSILMVSIMKKRDKIIKEIIEELRRDMNKYRKIINSKNIHGDTIYSWIVANNMEELGIEMLGEVDIDKSIFEMSNKYYLPIDQMMKKNMDRLTLDTIKRTKRETIKKLDDKKRYSSLIYSAMYLKKWETARELIKKTDKSRINKIYEINDYEKTTLLNMAIDNNQKEIAKELIKEMDIETIKTEECDMTSIERAREMMMEEVEEILGYIYDMDESVKRVIEIMETIDGKVKMNDIIKEKLIEMIRRN